MSALGMIHIDVARTFSGHPSRSAFRAWLHRARKRHPGIIVASRRLYIEESTFHQLHRADATFLAVITNHAGRNTPHPARVKNAPTPPRGIVLPLTRRPTP